MNILNVLDSIGRGGLERQFLELIKGIDKNKFKIFIIAFEEPPISYIEEIKTYSDVYFRIKRKIKYDPTVFVKIYKICKQMNIDLIHVWGGMSGFYSIPAWILTKAKFLNGSIRDVDRQKSFQQLINLLILKFSPNVVANSYAGLKAYNIKKGNVIYNGINMNRFSDKIKKQTNKFIVGIVANFNEYKDYNTFFKSINIIKDKIPNLEVHICGGGPYLEKNVQLVKDFGIDNIVRFFGPVSNTEDYIINFDIGVLCSYKKRGEGISNSILEYMAGSVPPIMAKVGAADEIIDDRITGLLYEPENANDLANKILELYFNKELRKKIAENAQRKVKDKFALDKYIKNFENLYISILKK